MLFHDENAKNTLNLKHQSIFKGGYMKLMICANAKKKEEESLWHLNTHGHVCWVSYRVGEQAIL